MSSPLNAADAITPALELTKRLMFKPMQWARWWRVAILALATGELASGGCNFSGPIGNLGNLGKHPPPRQFDDNIFQGLAFPSAMIPTLIVLAVVLVALLLILAFVHIYIGSVFRFVLFDAVTTARFKLLDGWRRWNRPGIRYFFFQLVFSFSSIGAMFLLALPFIVGSSQRNVQPRVYDQRQPRRHEHHCHSAAICSSLLSAGFGDSPLRCIRQRLCGSGYGPGRR